MRDGHFSDSGGPGKRRRKAIVVSSTSLIQRDFLPECGPLPLVIRPASVKVNLIVWARENRHTIERELWQHGAILFRGFAVNTVGAFEAFAEATSTGGLLDYKYGSTPRQRISGGVFTSTEYPADQPIPLHNEMSYSLAWPMKIWFCCLKSAPVGGATPIADSAKVFARIAPQIRSSFIKRGVIYTRNYGSGLDLSCQQVFGTTVRDDIEAFCKRANIVCEWYEGEKLRTRQKCQAIAVHPVTHKTVWFNQAHLFHVLSFPAHVSAQLLASFKEADLPRNAYYGDGTPIEQSTLENIAEAHRRETVQFCWQEGDLLMLDNMLVAHGRQPYEGNRQVIVAMAEQYNSTPGI